jgi:hypothetical protein
MQTRWIDELNGGSNVIQAGEKAQKAKLSTLPQANQL